MQKKYSRGLIGLLATAVLFIAVLVMMSIGTAGLQGSTDAEGIAATKQAIERGAVLCYATEGFYPPGISYLKENYGVQINESLYVVNYETIGSNIMPIIKVVGR